MEIKKLLQGPGSWLVILLPVFTISIKEATALEVFKWVDQQGVMHYSSEPPPGWASSTAEILNITPLKQSADQPEASVNYAKWLEMAKVLEQSRLARERLRLEKARLRMEAAGQQAVAQNITPVVECRALFSPCFYHRYRRHYPKLHHQGHSYRRSNETHAPAPKYISSRSVGLAQRNLTQHQTYHRRSGYAALTQPTGKYIKAYKGYRVRSSP